MQSALQKHITAGHRQISSGKWSKAVKSLTIAISEAEKSAQAHDLWIATALLAHAELLLSAPNAVSTFKKAASLALELHGESSDQYGTETLRAGIALEKFEQFDEAESHYKKAAHIFIANSESKLVVESLYLLHSLSEYRDQLAHHEVYLLSLVEQADSSNSKMLPYLLLRYGAVLDAQGKVEMAKTVNSTALLVASKDLLSNTHNLSMLLEHWASRREVFKREVSLMKELRAQVSTFADQLKEAEELECEDLAEFQHNYCSALLHLATTLREIHDPEAVPLLRKVHEFDEDDDKVTIDLAIAIVDHTSTQPELRLEFDALCREFDEATLPLPMVMSKALLSFRAEGPNPTAQALLEHAIFHNSNIAINLFLCKRTRKGILCGGRVERKIFERRQPIESKLTGREKGINVSTGSNSNSILCGAHRHEERLQRACWYRA